MTPYAKLTAFNPEINNKAISGLLLITLKDNFQDTKIKCKATEDNISLRAYEIVKMKVRLVRNQTQP